ncbi:folylpolyglutamate synthase, mitochondrial isoform X3 [Dipodomys merriami]|uniref:folylpolyglutamate synthase, mitochondrial isoform X3 n=1 Tax=Dipodomys merriami TaxID=94247 RepID=UPI00385137AC
MSWAPGRLRAALLLAAVRGPSAIIQCAARRGLSARLAPQEPGMEYQDAVRMLNTLQTNAGYLEQVKRQRGDPQAQLEAMELYLARSGLQVEDLDRLNIIHVTGTKGKGSTCAFTEHILRNYGLKTGFFSSPHLVQVRERIRINGQPISPELFSKHFWHLYHRLEETKDGSSVSMPAYFRFLTLMAFHIFLQEKVDLAVVEVGIGGAYDCTNIIRKPVVCGVSSLGIDHTSLLGDTMEKIAWQKGGIFKRGIPAFTVLQPEGPLAVLRDRAQQISCPLYLCPPLEALEEGGPPLALGLEGEHQRSNAALALQLANCWLQRHHQQTIQELKVSRPGNLWQLPLAPVFQPTSHMRHDQQNFTVTLDQVLLRCFQHQQHWSCLDKEQNSPDIWSPSNPELGGPASLLLASHLPRPCNTSSLVFSCISHALQWISQGRDPVFQPPSPSRNLLTHPMASSGANVLREAAAIHVLVTGSLHLVGGVLKLLEPSLSQ